jgi:hypothetical protein
MNAFKWAVIGAGPAGIGVVGKLLDQGVEASQIAWIDPEFKVGDFGTQWGKVSSNTKVELFLRFFQECHSFRYKEAASQFQISELDPSKTCLLGLAAEPLQWMSDHLKERVCAFNEKALQLEMKQKHWEIDLANTKIRAKNVVLAIGAEPKSLPFSGPEYISLQTALDPDKLALSCKPNDTVAVFGSSHSAIIILKTLLEKCDVNRVINFYLAPLRYATYFEDWVLFDDTGLKGDAAEWAKENIEGTLPNKLQRIVSTKENVEKELPNSSKVIYATGFQKRHISIAGLHSLDYNDKNGIIAPGLFGLGIAFPEAKTDRYGTLEHRVGLWKFMEYLNSILPLWFSYGV